MGQNFVTFTLDKNQIRQLIYWQMIVSHVLVSFGKLYSFHQIRQVFLPQIFA